MKDSSNKLLKTDTARASVSSRSQIPQDKYGMGTVWHQGEGMPPGGFRSVFSFRNGPNDTKNSPTTKPGKRIY